MSEPLNAQAVAAKGEEVRSLARRLAEASDEYGRMTAEYELAQAMLAHHDNVEPILRRSTNAG